MRFHELREYNFLLVSYLSASSCYIKIIVKTILTQPSFQIISVVYILDKPYCLSLRFLSSPAYLPVAKYEFSHFQLNTFDILPLSLSSSVPPYVREGTTLTN